MALEISVTICAYTEKRWDELAAAVASVQNQTLPPVEVIVVIDHNPSLYARAQQYLPNITLLENQGDKGLSGARNCGWTAARGEIVAFLDDDAIAHPRWLEQLAACYTSPEVLGVGGKILPLWETPQPAWFPDEFNWVIGCTYRGMPDRNMQIRNMIGANMSVRRAVLAAENGFRESFGCDKNTDSSSTQHGLQKWFRHYAGDEETEFCIRASQHRPQSIWLYASSATIQHRVSQTRTRWSYFIWRCYDEGLGKASLARLHSSSRALSTEKTYTFHVLPHGVLNGLKDTFLHHDRYGLARSAAIVAGLAVTTVGFLAGTFSSRLTSLKNPNLVPAKIPSSLKVQQ